MEFRYSRYKIGLLSILAGALIAFPLRGDDLKKDLESVCTYVEENGSSVSVDSSGKYISSKIVPITINNSLHYLMLSSTKEGKKDLVMQVISEDRKSSTKYRDFNSDTTLDELETGKLLGSQKKDNGSSFFYSSKPEKVTLEHEEKYKRVIRTIFSYINGKDKPTNPVTIPELKPGQGFG